MARILAQEVEDLEERDAASKDRRDRALNHLRKCLEVGWKDLEALRKDAHLAPLRDSPEFEALMKEWDGK